MAIRHNSSLCRAGIALGVALVLASCTKGGQFDPTEIFNSDMFDSKKKLKGDRVPVFPNGVPGTMTGVPPDLVKGYKPPPEQDAEIPPAPATAEAAKPKPKPKPRPKLAIEKPPSSQPTRIDVGAKPGTPPPASSPSVWPAPARSAPAQQSAWPPPSQSAPAQQSALPAPPQTVPTQQAAQPSQSIWPSPPASGTTSQ